MGISDEWDTSREMGRFFYFCGYNISTIRNRYKNVYLVLGDTWRKEREQRNVEEASEDEEPDNHNE